MVKNAKEKRLKDLLFETLELLRSEIRKEFGDWKDADDHIFAELSFTAKELDELYKDRNVMIYTGSAIQEEEI